MRQDNPYALERGITVSREPSAPSAPPAPDGSDNDVLELNARFENIMLQDKVKYLQKHVDERTAELAKVNEENVSLRYELFNTKAEVEKLQERMRS